MKLRHWLSSRQITHARFAEMIGVSSRVVVSRYVRGERTPDPEIMARIIKVTDGVVTPNDFFDVTADDENSAVCPAYLGGE